MSKKQSLSSENSQSRVGPGGSKATLCNDSPNRGKYQVPGHGEVVGGVEMTYPNPRGKEPDGREHFLELRNN